MPADLTPADTVPTVKIFVGNLSADTSQEELAAVFEPYGTVMSCSVLRQFAFVHLAGREGAARAVQELHGREFRGRSLVVEESRGRPRNSTKVFVGNLAALCSAPDLQELFQTFGKVLECDKVKGYAFVHMESQEAALQAIEALHGTRYKGRPLSVELSKVQPSKRPSTGKIPCVSCGKSGHYAGDCPLLLPQPQPQTALEQYQNQAVAVAAGVPLPPQYQALPSSFYTAYPPSMYGPAYGADGTLLYRTVPEHMYGSVANAATFNAMANQLYATVENQGYTPTVGNPVYATAGTPVYSGAVGGASSPVYSASVTNPAYSYGAVGSPVPVADPSAQAVFEATQAQFYAQQQEKPGSPAAAIAAAAAAAAAVAYYGTRERGAERGFQYQRKRALLPTPASTEEELISYQKKLAR
ncbi:RBM14 protein, partial [Polyodon spathula]|nr:RBM14 protein [Polyodon spathula]